MSTTNHAEQIERLRRDRPTPENRLAADLLELHDKTGIRLDDWESARTFVESKVGPIQPNGV